MRASFSSRTVALIVACAFFMENLDATALATALPAMARSFGVAPVALGIGITGYMLALAVCIPLSGWVADRLGTRTVFCAGISVFVGASIACGMSSGPAEFTAARILQGASAAFMSPVGRLAVIRSASPSELIGAIALITWPGLIAPVIGPAVGGFIATYLGWRWIFFLNVPIGVVGLALAWFLIDNERGDARRPFDTIGFALTAASLAALIYGVQTIGTGDAPRLGAAFLSGAVAIGAAAVLHARRAPFPLVDLSLLRIPTFAVSTVSGGALLRVTSGAMPFLLPLMFQTGFGMSAAEAGLLVLAYAAGNLGMKSVTTIVLRRYGFRRVLVGNGILAALSILACATLSPWMATEAVLLVLFAAGCFRSLQHTSVATLTFADVPSVQKGAATTFAAMQHQVAISLGVAVGSLAASLSALARGGAGTSVGLADFRVAIVVLAVFGLLSVAVFAKLAADAGAEVSGQKKADWRNP